MVNKDESENKGMIVYSNFMFYIFRFLQEHARLAEQPPKNRYFNSLKENVCWFYYAISKYVPLKVDLRLLDFVIDSLFMKLFRTNN